MYVAIALTIIALVVGFAWWRGGAPERWFAWIFVANTITGLVRIELLGYWNYRSVNPFMAPIDLVTLFVMVGVALRANRMWPLLMTALQIIVICAHAAMLVYHGNNQAYWAMISYAQYVQMLILVIATRAHVTRLRHIGPYRAWR